jgi:hypothetical protein
VGKPEGKRPLGRPRRRWEDGIRIDLREIGCGLWIGRTCGTHGRGEKNVQGLVGKPEGKRPLGRPRRRWEDGIRIDVREIACGVWIGFDWLRLGTGGELL